MTWLALAALFMAAATAWYVARPLARAAVPNDRERLGQLQQLRERLLAQLNELDVEEADRNVDAAVVGDERRRLETELAEALRELEALGKESGKREQAETGRRGRVVALLVLGIVPPLAAAGLYALNQRTTLAYLFHPDTQTAGPVPPVVHEMVARLEARLKEQPDAAGWARLGRAYAVLDRPEQAAAAYARAYRLSPDDPRIIAEYAAFLYHGDPRNTGGQAYVLYSRLLKLDTQNADALWFLGFAAYRQGDYPQALGFWKQLLKLMPPESREADRLRAVIAETRGKLAKK